MELTIIKYIKENGLHKSVSDFKLKVREYDSKILLKYDQIESSMGLFEVQDCRGLILEKDTWNIMCLSFRKFFNNSEGHAARIDWNTAHVLEKLDGTMIQVYWDWNKEEWFAATTGTAEGEGQVNNKYGTTFNELFWNTMDNKYGLSKEHLTSRSGFVKGYVYVFELTTPYNIVVKPHAESSATLLAIRNLTGLVELDYGSMKSIAKSMGFPVVKRYDLNAKNAGTIIKTFENMVWYDEGYVVVDGNFNRVKLKNPAYVAVHHLKSKTSEHAIMDVVKTNEIEEFASTFPERREEIFNLHKNYNGLIDKLNNLWITLETLKPKNITAGEKKRYAMEVFKTCEENNIKNFTGLYFSLANNKVNSVNDFMFNYDNKKLYNIL
tara:strand:+ start:652 stop:1791 length:1140 start_codon:yes stop_codon:yes gene_type:complete